MTTVGRTRNETRSKPRQLEALAFYLGAHGIDSAPVMEEIEARFNQEISEEKQEPLRNLHALEAKLQQVRKERPEAEALWQRIRKELGDTPPPFFHAIVMAVFACFALVLDTLFLAPTMDILNIADPALQYLAAAGVAAVCTGIFELSAWHFVNAKNVAQKHSALVSGGMGVLSLIVWGLLRGHQLRFAAGLAGNPLGDFLDAHPFLASVFFIFITLATPMVGAVALLHGWSEFSAARTWRRVRERFETLRTAEVTLSRQVQAEAGRLAEFDKRKAEECREWKSVFAYFYERGQRNGARREPLWSVLLKSAAGALIVTPLAFLVPAVWFPAQLAVPIIPGVALFAYFNHRRHHPSHERYLKAENTQFAVIPEAPKLREIHTPQPRLLSKGDPS
jgi:hypothetical protein